MTRPCPRCEAPTNRGLCRECRLERDHGTPEVPAEAVQSGWTIAQTGLDGEAEGQTTLDGGVVKPEEGEDAD